jgi:hypothetical protein
MTFRGSCEGHKSAREMTFFVQGTMGSRAAFKGFPPPPSLPSSLLTPRIITLLFYEPSRTT